MAERVAFPMVERLMDDAELDAVIAVEEASFNNPTARSWYEGELARPDVCHLYVIRTADTSVAGFCTFWLVADQMHINNLAIAPALRGRGLGRHLLGCVLAAAQAGGATSATLEVRPSNQAAIRLYMSAGFRVAATRPAYYTQPIEDALILWRHADEGPET